MADQLRVPGGGLPGDGVRAGPLMALYHCLEQIRLKASNQPVAFPGGKGDQLLQQLELGFRPARHG